MRKQKAVFQNPFFFFAAGFFIGLFVKFLPLFFISVCLMQLQPLFLSMHPAIPSAHPIQLQSEPTLIHPESKSRSIPERAYFLPAPTRSSVS